jgi:glycosyltransferase involved in cell wall biosynthesis
MDKWRSKYFFLIWCDRILANFTYKIICCSKAVKDYIIRSEKIPEKKLIPMMNCLDFSWLDVTETKGELRDKYGFKKEDFMLGVVGTLKPAKGHAYLIDALGILLSKYSDITLLIIGDGPSKAELMRHVEQRKLERNVKFLGERTDVKYLLGLMDVFVMPSVSEGLGLAILEAMYFGLPVVASNIGGIPEIISDGISGILVKPRSPEFLAGAVQKLKEDKVFSASLGEEARKFVTNNCNAQHYAKSLINIYDSFSKN